MLVSDYNNCPAFLTVQFKQLEAITDGTNIARIGMQKVDRPIFGFFPIVSKRAGNFEFECPEAFDKQVRCSLRGDAAFVYIEFL